MALKTCANSLFSYKFPVNSFSLEVFAAILCFNDLPRATTPELSNCVLNIGIVSLLKLFYLMATWMSFMIEDRRGATFILIGGE